MRSRWPRALASYRAFRDPPGVPHARQGQATSEQVQARGPKGSTYNAIAAPSARPSWGTVREQGQARKPLRPQTHSRARALLPPYSGPGRG